MNEIYEPAEDSYLMSEALGAELPELLSKNPQLKLLEIGVGSGINLNIAKDAGIKIKNIFGCDINNEAVNHCRKLGFNCIKSNLFGEVNGKFNVIIFNPPYLPEDEREPKDSRLTTTGGLQGNELTIKFLKEAKEHLSKDGRIFLITSSLASSINFNLLGYLAGVLLSEKLFFEKLTAWELSLNSK